MRDPFADLRATTAPVDPDPEFATRLRARLERALALPRGVIPVTSVTEAAPTPRPAAIPYLAVSDARSALDWYADVFGAEVQGEPIVMPDGRIGHAELEIDGGLIYLADEHPEIGVTAPRAGESPVSLMLPVPDADAVRARAVAAGVNGDRPPYDGYGQRNAWIVDPFGHRWGLHSPLPASGAPPRYHHGDVGHVSLNTADAARATEFYAAVLGWTYTDFERPRVDGATPSTGIWETDEPTTVFCAYAVDDVREAVRRVREAGGSAGDPQRQPWGLTADCTDDQGTTFALFEQPDDVTGDRPPPNGKRAGDPSYLTVEVVDSARARAFYGAVLGWQFRPGSVEDGWQVEDTVPMIGLAGGKARATIVPMWKVADVRRAVEAVRAAGGTATDPERQPYGTTSECADDQGMRFYLGDA